jgi:hypothetical protein
MKSGHIISFLIGFFACGVWASFFEYSHYIIKPTAMDVYQGKTTLEITYKDNKAIDSVVVWKNKTK